MKSQSRKRSLASTQRLRASIRARNRLKTALLRSTLRSLRRLPWSEALNTDPQSRRLVANALRFSPRLIRMNQGGGDFWISPLERLRRELARSQAYDREMYSRSTATFSALKVATPFS